jgi:hypothetical protein
VDFLTNGQQGVVIFRFPPGLNGGGKFKVAFNGGYPGIDLCGLTIEGLDLTVDSFNPWKDYDSNYYAEVQITLVIRGVFPWWWRYRALYSWVAASGIGIALVLGAAIGLMFGPAR